MQVQLSAVELWSWACRYLTVAINDTTPPVDRGFYSHWIKTAACLPVCLSYPNQLLQSLKALTINHRFVFFFFFSCRVTHVNFSTDPNSRREPYPTAALCRQVVWPSRSACLERRLGLGSRSICSPSRQQAPGIFNYLFESSSFWMPLSLLSLSPVLNRPVELAVIPTASLPVNRIRQTCASSNPHPPPPHTHTQITRLDNGNGLVRELVATCSKALSLLFVLCAISIFEMRWKHTTNATNVTSLCPTNRSMTVLDGKQQLCSAVQCSAVSSTIPQSLCLLCGCVRREHKKERKESGDQWSVSASWCLLCHSRYLFLSLGRVVVYIIFFIFFGCCSIGDLSDQYIDGPTDAPTLCRPRY